VSRACQIDVGHRGAARHFLRATGSALLAALALTGAKAVPGPAVANLVVLRTREGEIRIRLHPREAPIACANFRRLVQAGFYDHTYFHRALPAFVIQGGDPNTARNADPADDGLGGAGYRLPAEAGGPAVRGSVAMARLPDALNPSHENDGCQFYIVLRRQPSLDATGGTVFGDVIAGMDVVERIAALAYQKDVLQAAAGANPQDRARIVRASLEPVAAR